jgi:2-polyprenyl-3-methyl-5-hydroxy-6-metoxy-1,4-benzoquinol methylase
MANIDNVHCWDISSLNYGDIFHTLTSWANTPGFGVIKHEILKHFGTFKGLRFVELGAGIGKMSILMDILGGQTTLIDYNKNALKKAQEVQGFFGCEPDLLLESALALPASICGQYDVVMSFGLAEHFLGEERTAIFHSHHKLAKKHGIVVISVPNALGLSYRLSHGVRKALGKWPKGLSEVPFTRKKLKNIALKIGLTDIRISGGNRFLRDFNYFLIGNAKQAIRRHIFRKKNVKSQPFTEDNPREKLREIMLHNDTTPGFLDNYLSYPLFLIAYR